MRLSRSCRFSAGVLVFAALLGACRLNTVGPVAPTQTSAPQLMVESTLGSLNSQEALARGPLVVIFYRGHW